MIQRSVSYLSSQNLEVIRWVTSLLSPSKNMQLCNEQIRTQPLFSPPCASATYGSARMCRRKNLCSCDEMDRKQCATFTYYAWVRSDIHYNKYYLNSWQKDRLQNLCNMPQNVLKFTSIHHLAFSGSSEVLNKMVLSCLVPHFVNKFKVSILIDMTEE